MRSFRRFAICCLVVLSFGATGIAQEAEEHVHGSVPRHYSKRTGNGACSREVNSQMVGGCAVSGI
jgi:hypothetical protein